MRVVFIGTVRFSEKILELLFSLNADIRGVVTKKGSSFNSDFVDLLPLCKTYKYECRQVDDINSVDSVEWIRSCNPDIVFCFGWSHLLKREVLNIAPMGVVGFHPAPLPLNRGRHPMIWALALGLEKTASTFFFMDEGTDSGDILSQIEIAIDYEDDAGTLYHKVVESAVKQVTEFLPQLQQKTFRRIPQNHSIANVWRKRGEKDGAIDFRMNSRAVYNLVRSLAKPYVGAHLVHKGERVKVWKVREVEVEQKNIEPGKVITKDGNNIMVKCYDGAVVLTEHEFKALPDVGEYL